MGKIEKTFEKTYGILATSIENYISLDGFEALKRVINMTKEEIIEELKTSALLGRGGAGFPTWKKWQMFCEEQGDEKYIVCNADESEPGTFKDRMFLTHRPFAILEGMLIAAYVSGAKKGYIYARGEYRMLQYTIIDVIMIANQSGYLGKNIMGVEGFDFELKLATGAGAYVCGEDSALLNSIEGKAGRPKVKPPFPTDDGLFGIPTLVNNVETFAQVKTVFFEGGEAFLENGTKTDGGTRLVCISGKAKNRGLFEVTSGTTLREILYDEELAGGTSSGRPVKFFHTGGQTSPIAFPEQFETKFSFDEMRKAGLSLGSGSLTVLDDSVCLVEYCKLVMNFLVNESCGKCTPCRIGTTRLYELLERFCEGDAVEGDIEKLEKLAGEVASYSACGLGQASDKALVSAIKYRREEFEEHIHGICRTGCCKNLRKGE